MTHRNENTGSISTLESSLKEVMSKLDQRERELSAIRELLEGSEEKLTSGELLGFLLEKSMSVTGAQIGSVFMLDMITPQMSLITADQFDELSQIYRFRVVASRGQDLKLGSYIDIKDSLVKSVVEQKKPLLVENVETDPRTHKANDSRYGSPSFLSMPFFTQGRLAAVVNLARKKDNASFNQNDERILAIMLRQISLLLENSARRSALITRSDKADTLKFEKEREIRLKLEQVLKENEKRYRELVDDIPVPLFEMSLKGKLIIANPACFEMFGYKRENFDEDTNIFVTMFVLEDQATIRSNIQKIISGEYETGRTVYRGLKKDGTTFPVRIFVKPIYFRSIPVGLRGTIIPVDR